MSYVLFLILVTRKHQYFSHASSNPGSRCTHMRRTISADVFKSDAHVLQSLQRQKFCVTVSFVYIFQVKAVGRIVKNALKFLSTSGDMRPNKSVFKKLIKSKQETFQFNLNDQVLSQRGKWYFKKSPSFYILLTEIYGGIYNEHSNLEFFWKYFKRKGGMR